MKRMILLVLATALTAGPALAAIEFNGEVFVNHKATLKGLTETAAKNEGTDMDRVRLMFSNKFNDQWSFKGAMEGLSLATPNTNKFYVPYAFFVGTGIAMANDTLSVGNITANEFNFDSMGNRWIQRPVIQDEGFMVSVAQTGVSYKMAFNALNVTLSSSSAETADDVDTDDNTKMNGILLDYKINDSFLVWASNKTVGTTLANTGVAVAAAKSTVVTLAGLNYKSEMVDAGFTYASAAYTVETGTAPKNNSVMSLTGLFKKLGGSSTNLYVDYRAGFDAYADAGGGTAEDTQSKLMIGPTWTLAEGKINLGAFYQMETFQGDYKTANPTATEPSAAYVRLAAKF